MRFAVAFMLQFSARYARRVAAISLRCSAS
jgi:hypothetical protein